MPTILLVPGWTDSDPEHWQTRWERENPAWRRLRGVNWDAPKREEWIPALDAAIREIGGPVVLVCHSLGCHAAVWWAAQHQNGPVVGAFLVAPPDIERADMPPEITGFTPVPCEKLPFSSMLVSSGDDPLCAGDVARTYAAAWGCQHASLGNAGHVNTDAGFGPWPEGLRLLAEFVNGLQSSQ